jgi:hypothetical protein
MSHRTSYRYYRAEPSSALSAVRLSPVSLDMFLSPPPFSSLHFCVVTISVLSFYVHHIPIIILWMLVSSSLGLLSFILRSGVNIILQVQSRISNGANTCLSVAWIGRRKTLLAYTVIFVVGAVRKFVHLSV